MSSSGESASSRWRLGSVGSPGFPEILPWGNTTFFGASTPGAFGGTVAGFSTGFGAVGCFGATFRSGFFTGLTTAFGFSDLAGGLAALFTATDFAAAAFARTFAFTLTAVLVILVAFLVAVFATEVLHRVVPLPCAGRSMFFGLSRSTRPASCASQAGDG